MQHLKLFLQPDILQRIGARRLGRLLRPFAPELQAINFPMPPPDEPRQNHYFHSLAAALARADTLPPSVLNTLLTLETAAAPESRIALGDAIKRRVPNVSLPPGFFIDHALELWIVAPEELARFAPPDLAPSIPQSPNPSIQSDPSATPAPESGLAPSIHQATNPSIQPEFARLARLSAVEYDQVRRAEAKRLNLRLRTLDNAVDDARSALDDAEASKILASQTEPWPEPILDAPALFDEVHDRALRYLYLPPGAAVVLALWPAHAHATNAFTHSPRLHLTSLQPGCGKSTALDFLTPLCPSVLLTNSLKPAVLYRVMHRGHFTVFLDEIDAYLQRYPELRGLLNASNKPNSCVHRCEGNSVRVFRIYAATALAGLGYLTPTLRHRSIVITLHEAPPGLLKARFNPHHLQAETILGRKIARWAKDNFNPLAACDPLMPPKLHNRPADNWRPLFAVAQVIGGHWPQRITQAFHQLNSPSSPSAGSLSAQLLSDIRLIFTQTTATRLFSSALIEALCALPGRPWSALPRDNGTLKPIDETWLSRQLRPLAVHSRTLRINGQKAKGYELPDFLEPFAKFAAVIGPSGGKSELP